MRLGTQLALSFLIVVVAAVVWGPSLLVRFDDWGQPVIRETFSDEGWQSRWFVTKGRLDRREGRLVTSGTLESALMLRQHLPGSVAVEFVGEVLPGSRACDLSVCWYEQPVFSEDGSKMQASAEHRLQLGAYDNSYSCIISDGQLVSYSDFILQVGRPYRIRAEFSGSLMRLVVDGREILRHTLRYPLGDGHPGIFGYYPGKAFSQVTVWQRPAGSDGKAAHAERLARQRKHADAAAAFQSAANEVSPALRGDMQVAAARGWELAGNADTAAAAWEAVAAGDHAALATLRSLKQDFSRGEWARTAARFVEAYRLCPLRFRQDYQLAWSHWVADLRSRWLPLSVYRCFLDAYLACLTDCELADREAAELFLLLGRNEDVVERFPRQAAVASQALLGMGRINEAYERYGHVPFAKLMILYALGRYDQAMVEGPPWSVSMTLREAGRFQEAIDYYSDEPISVAIALQNLGRFQEVLDRYAEVKELRAIRADCLLALGRHEEALSLVTQDDERMNILLRLGRAREAMALCERDFQRQQTARDLLGLEAWIAGRTTEAKDWFSPVTPHVFAWSPSYGLRRYVLQPYLYGLAGDQAARQKRLTEGSALSEPWQGRLQRWSGVLSGISSVPDVMPSDRDELMVWAVAHDERQNRAEALRGYRSYIAEAPLGDPVLRRFAFWRVQAMTGPE